MASGFFLLMRFFLRVDGVLVRINDTRLYLQVREGLADGQEGEGGTSRLGKRVREGLAGRARG